MIGVPETASNHSPGSARLFQSPASRLTAGVEDVVMGSRRKTWSRAKICRVMESVHSGGFAAYRSRLGRSIWLSGDGAEPNRRRGFVPNRSLRSRHARWLGARLTGAYRRALSRIDGAQMISGSVARDLLRWCTRWVRPRSQPRLTATQRDQATKF